MSQLRLYRDLCAPTITLAVGLNVGVVLQPVADSANAASNVTDSEIVAILLVIFL